MIDHENAEHIALDALRERGYVGCSTQAVRFREAGRVNVYGISQDVLMNSWVAYAIDRAPVLAIRSSTIVIVAGDTGRVLYVGSANDEG